MTQVVTISWDAPTTSTDGSPISGAFQYSVTFNPSNPNAPLSPTITATGASISAPFSDGEYTVMVETIESVNLISAPVTASFTVPGINLPISAPALGILPNNWVVPTTFTDGSSLPEGFITGYELFVDGTQITGATFTAPLNGQIGVASGFPTLSVGTHNVTLVATAANAAQNSAPSAPWLEVQQAPPNPPSALTITFGAIS